TPPPPQPGTQQAHPRDASGPGYDRREVTCPQGQVSKGWHGPYPTSSPDAAPLIVARFTKEQCQPCPARAACTTSGDGKRTVGFPPRELYELQVRNRAGQQDPPGTSATLCGPASREPSASSPAATACAAAATRDSPRPTCSTS